MAIDRRSFIGSLFSLPAIGSAASFAPDVKDGWWWSVFGPVIRWWKTEVTGEWLPVADEGYGPGTKLAEEMKISNTGPLRLLDPGQVVISSFEFKKLGEDEHGVHLEFTSPELGPLMEPGGQRPWKRLSSFGGVSEKEKHIINATRLPTGLNWKRN